MDYLIEEVYNNINDEHFVKKITPKKIEIFEKTRECEVFQIHEYGQQYKVIIPLLNSKYSYALKMKNESDIKEYFLKQINNYVNKKNK